MCPGSTPEWSSTPEWPSTGVLSGTRSGSLPWGTVSTPERVETDVSVDVCRISLHKIKNSLFKDMDLSVSSF